MGYVVIAVAVLSGSIVTLLAWHIDRINRNIAALTQSQASLLEILAQSEKRLEDTVLAESNATHGLIKHQLLTIDSLRLNDRLAELAQTASGQFSIRKQQYRELNDRLIALETAPKPEPRRAAEEDPAGGWTTVRARVERGSMVPEGVLNA